MRYFLDLGAYTGDTLKKAIKKYGKKFDHFVGFEPVPYFFNKAVKAFKDNPKVKMYCCAAGVVTERRKLYLHRFPKGPGKMGKGSSFFVDKLTGGLTEKDALSVKTINFSRWVMKNINPEQDKVILKIDIEGSEYDLLEHMIETGAIKRINKLYVEWHSHKIPGLDEKHAAIVKKLQDLGFPITGKRKLDNFDKKF